MPEIQITVKDATTTEYVAPTSGSVKFTPSRLAKDGFLATAAPFEATLVNGAAMVFLDVTPPGVAYKVVEHFVGGDGSGDRYVVVEEGDSRYELLTVVSKPGTSQPTAVWQENLRITEAKAEAAVADAAAAVQAVEALAQTVADLPAPPDISGLATTEYVDEAIAQIPEPVLTPPLGSANNPVTNAAATRPINLDAVYWRSATQPTNWLPGDVWMRVG